METSGTAKSDLRALVFEKDKKFEKVVGLFSNAGSTSSEYWNSANNLRVAVIDHLIITVASENIQNAERLEEYAEAVYERYMKCMGLLLSEMYK